MINLSWAPTKGELTEYTRNGIDMMSTLPPRDQKTEYVDSYIEKQPVVYNVPAKALKQTYPFGSFGLNAGLVIFL